MRPIASSKVATYDAPNRAWGSLPMMPRSDQQYHSTFTHESLASLSPEQSANQLCDKSSPDFPLSTASSSMKYLLIVFGTLMTIVTLAMMTLSIYLVVVISKTITTTTTTTTATTTWPSQCSSYTTITDSTRLLSARNGTQCDQAVFSNVTSAWYRFSGAGGTQIVTSAPVVYQCDTDATGWFTNTMPTTGATVFGTVCYVWFSSTCYWSKSISVTHCGSFYVYNLIAPPTCKLRYCTI